MGRVIGNFRPHGRDDDFKLTDWVKTTESETAQGRAGTREMLRALFIILTNAG